MEQLGLLAAIGADSDFEASPVHGVYQSDSLLPELERTVDLSTCALRLERAVPLDPHPGAHGQVMDVVHPSLFPLIAGVSPLRERPALTLKASFANDLGDLGLAPICHLGAVREREAFCMSDHYQWLPTEFAVSAGGEVTINSYVNNLHPLEHAEMYPALEAAFAAGLPLLEQVLSDTLVTDTRRQCWRLIRDASGQNMYEGGHDPPDDDDDDSAEAAQPLRLELPAHFPVAETERCYIPRSVNLRGQRLQVIVKLARIELTPAQPTYPGGVWHCEGMRNEHIVATLIHYYSCENVSESRLNFRQAICEPDYAQDDNNGVQTRYGLGDQAPLNEELGYITAQGGRSVAFPNVFQHAVAPFQLQDPSRQGHRKILVFFLVDPLHRVTSTADVPPQQRSWVAGREQLHELSAVHRLLYCRRVPRDVVNYILEFLSFPMSVQAAEEHRIALMNERSRYTDEVTQKVFEREFSLCEH